MAKVLCIGDHSRETYLLPAGADDAEDKSRLHSTSSVYAVELNGGPERIAAMLSDLNCFRPEAPEAFRSWLKLKKYDKKALRVEQFMGIETLPNVNWGSWAKTKAPKWPRKVDVIVFADQNKGFRNSKVWESILEKYPDTPVVLRLHAPFKGRLLKAVTARDNSVVIVDGRDVRRMGGACVTQAISWENTAEGFRRSMEAGKPHALTELNQARALIALFGIEGTVLQTNNNGAVSRKLLFDANALENHRTDALPGTMLGLHAAVVCEVVRAIARGPKRVNWIPAIRKGMLNASKMAIAGFESTQRELNWPSRTPEDWQAPPLVSVDIPESNSEPADQWDILTAADNRPIETLAIDTLISGPDASLPKATQIKFGIIRLADRRSIEQYSVIRTLMTDYLARRKLKTPLNIALFGSPGSGKSFAVKQILKSIKGGADKINEHTINLSQCGCYEDLLPILRSVRDDRIKGKVPCVFFDEFDSSKGQTAWGWLKYFLAPMQDGEYADGNESHPLGGGMFFFAGGTAESLDQFAGLAETRSTREAFKAAKGPDFISRLHGYLDIAGPNQTDPGDEIWPLRRAITLHGLLKKKYKAIVDDDKKLRIDETLAQRLLFNAEYIHGNRSMARLVDAMSTAKLERLTASALPAREILKLYCNIKDE